MFTRRQFLFGAGTAAAIMPNLARASVPVEVPITATQSGLPMVDVMIGGKGPYRFIVASGAASYCIRRDLPSQLGLKAKSGLFEKLLSPTTASLDGNETTAKYPCDSLSVASITLPPLILEAYEIAEGADGMLGTGFFTWRSVEIDMEAGVMRLYDDSSPDLGTYTSLPSRRQGSISSDPPFIITPVAFGGISAECVINTCSSAGVYLSSDFVRKHGLWDLPGIVDRPVNGGGRLVASRGGQVDGISIGPLSFDGVSLYLGNPDYNDNVGDILGGAGGVIGMNLLRRCNLFIPRDEGLYLRRLAD